MLAKVIDQERFKRFEKKPGAVPDARRIFALVAGQTAQFLQDQFGRAEVLAAQQSALELGNKHRPRLRR